MGLIKDRVKDSSQPGPVDQRVVRDVGLMFFGARTLVTRHGPTGEAQFRLWCQADDHGGYFTAKVDIRPGDLVTIPLDQGGTTQRIVDTITAALNGRTRASWRIPTGAPHALGLTDLHPAVRAAAEQLYRDGHYARAVAEAFKAIELAVRDRVPTAGTGAGALGKAFADNGPIDVRRHPGQTGADEQSGFRHLFMGAAGALRNPRVHEAVDDDPLSALEHLAVASLLLRRLDTARTGQPAQRAASPDAAPKEERPPPSAGLGPLRNQDAPDDDQ
jgi:uncharacterized protein (TIGR02391 family)